MSWKRLATYALGGALIGVSIFVPGAAPVLGPAGAGLIGLATSWPGDVKKIQNLQVAAAEQRGIETGKDAAETAASSIA